MRINTFYPPGAGGGGGGSQGVDGWGGGGFFRGNLKENIKREMGVWWGVGAVAGWGCSESGGCENGGGEEGGGGEGFKRCIGGGEDLKRYKKAAQGVWGGGGGCGGNLEDNRGGDLGP